MANSESVKVGSHVLIRRDYPGSKPVEGIVIKVNDPGSKEAKAGHQIGVELNEHHPLAHSLDAKRGSDGEPLKDKKGNIKYDVAQGRGWWTSAENVEVLD